MKQRIPSALLLGLLILFIFRQHIKNKFSSKYSNGSRNLQSDKSSNNRVKSWIQKKTLIANEYVDIFNTFGIEMLLTMQGPYDSDGITKEIVQMVVKDPAHPTVVSSILVSLEKSFDYLFDFIRWEIPYESQFKECQNNEFKRFNILKTFPHSVGGNSGNTVSAALLPIKLPSAIVVKKNKNVVIFTICNQVHLTVVALKYLKSSLEDLSETTDLIIMDDHSSDGSSQYLRKKGFFVITVPEDKGLAYMWNKGYEFGVTYGYKNIFFVNSDVLVPRGALPLMINDLETQAFIVPLTSTVGQAHYPAQAITSAYKLKESLEDYASNPRHVQNIQSALFPKVKATGIRLSSLLQHNMTSTPKFNGVFFGLNVDRMKMAAFRHPKELFDITQKTNGPENALLAKMAQLNIIPQISLSAYCYHYQSPTEGSSGSGKAGVNPSKENTLRTSDANPAQVSPTKLLSSGGDSQSVANVYESQINPLSISSPSFSSNGISCQSRRNVLCGYHCNYDTMTADILNLNSTTDANKGNVPTRCYIIAFATSDPVRSPTAGDIFTANELAKQLLTLYPTAITEIRFLRKGVNWFDFRALYNVDILISMLDDFDVSVALSTSLSVDYYKDNPLYKNEAYELKATMVTVAWARNWFQRWLYRPYFGNFDLVLVSSDFVKTFYSKYQETYGLRKQCINFCPQFEFPNSLEYNLSDVRPYEPRRNHGGFGGDKDVSKTAIPPSTFQVSVEVGYLRARITPREYGVSVFPLRLATNHLIFMPPDTSIENLVIHPTVSEEVSRKIRTADYGFTGSYHNVYRKIMSFDPTKVDQKFKGVVIGSGWEKADVSVPWRAMTSGSVPYEAMPNIYKCLKIIVDDANHVTEPWGSINSRVFDAIAAGALPVTNGKLGASEICGGIIPVYQSMDELASLLNEYLLNDDKRKNLVKRLRDCILEQHTYRHRAVELSKVLASQFNIIMGAETNSEPKYVDLMDLIHEKKLLPLDIVRKSYDLAKEKKRASRRLGLADKTPADKKHVYLLEKAAIDSAQSRKEDLSTAIVSAITFPTQSFAEPGGARISALPQSRQEVCIGIRTFFKKYHWLSILLRSFISQYVTSKFNVDVSMKIFIIDTETNGSNKDELNKIIREVYETYRDGHQSLHRMFNVDIFLVTDNLATNQRFQNPFYGYDSTDVLLNHMLSASTAPSSITDATLACPFLDRNCSTYFSRLHPQRDHWTDFKCDWIMITNGDNIYNAAWFDTVSRYMLAPPTSKAEHANAIGWDFVTHHSRDSVSHQYIPIAFKRGCVDLGSVMIRRELFHDSLFLPMSLFTTDLFARDYHMIRDLFSNIKDNSTIRLIHEGLMFHQ